MTYLSYLMGAEDIKDNDLTSLNVTIEEKMSNGDRTLKIPTDKLPKYLELIKTKLSNGFWNEVIGTDEIIFFFKFKDGSNKEYNLSTENENEVAKLCSEFTSEPLNKTANVYKYISGNKFYKDFMLEHYTDLVNR